MSNQLEAIRGNEQRQINQQIQSTNFEGNGQSEEIAPGIPVNNDAALAAYLKESRDKSTEYARLTTEASRQQWEAMAADNFRRDQANKSQIETSMAVSRMNQAVSDRAEGERLFSELQAVTRDIPAEVLNREGEEWRIDLDKLRDISKATQKVADFTQRLNPQQAQSQPQQQRPETFPDGQAVHVTQNQDGTLHVEYATGEKFDGDPLTVTQRIGQAHVSTKRWAQQQRAQSQQQYQQPAQQPTQVEQPQVHSESTGSLADDLAARQADQLARQFGFSNRNEMVQWGESVNEKMAKVQQYETTQEATRFYNLCPEFPANDHAINTVSQIMDNLHLPMTAEGMQAAHALAVQRGDYQPLSQEAIQASYVGSTPQNHRPTPPPMLGTGNPEVTMATPDPYGMNLGELRKLAIAQELNGGGRR